MSSSETLAATLVHAEGPIAAGDCRLEGQAGASEVLVERLQRAADLVGASAVAASTTNGPEGC